MGNLIRVWPKIRSKRGKVIRFLNVSNIIIKNENHCQKSWSLNKWDCICAFKLALYLFLQQNLEGLDMDTEKKSLVSREIRSFRDTYRVSLLSLVLCNESFCLYVIVFWLSVFRLYLRILITRKHWSYFSTNSFLFSYSVAVMLLRGQQFCYWAVTDRFVSIMSVCASRDSGFWL